VILAILGGSHGGLAAAADLSLAGHRVRLWARAAATLGPLCDDPTVQLVSGGPQGRARLELATTDIGEAVADAEVVVVALPATAHEELAGRLAPYLTDRQTVLLAPGTLGSLVLAREIARAGGTLPQALGEAGTLPYLARATRPAVVHVPVRAANLPIGVFPASRRDAAIARFAELFACVRPCVDVLDAALTNIGPVIHPPLVLLNARALDEGPFDIHAAGTTPSVRRLIDVVDAERIATRQGWRYPAPHYEIATYYDAARAVEGLYGVDARTARVASGLWREVVTFEHRYVTEDTVLGLSLLESAARAAGAPTPGISGLLLVFGALLGRDLSGRGRALEALGLGDLSRREIGALLEEGWESAVWRRVVR